MGRAWLAAPVAAMVLAAAAVDPGECGPRWQASVSPNGSVRLQRDGRDFGTLEPGLFEAVWRGVSLAPAKPGQAAKEGVCQGQIRAPGGGIVESEVRVEPVAGGLRLGYRLTPQSELRLNSLHVAIALPVSRLLGGAFSVDGKSTPFPQNLGQTHLFNGPVRSLEVKAADGSALRLEFAEATPVLVQDDRQWGPSFTVRIGPQDGEARPWPTGKTHAVEFTLSAEGGMDVEMDGPITIEPGADWLPLDVELDIEPGSALDFTNLVPRHLPAGILGRVIASPSGHFEFADRPGQPARFYGVNLCFTAHYISHEQADRLAERLQRLGYNALRIHHYESTLTDRSQGTSTTLKSQERDQLEYLIAALKRRGLYITTDLFVSRQAFANEIWEGATGNVEMDTYKMAVPVNERAFANFKAFATAFLGHLNPYTGLRLSEDPALAWLSLINEGNFGNYLGRLSGPVAEDWTRAWNRWLAARYPDRPALAAALGTLQDGQDAAAGTVPLPRAVDSSPAGIALSVFLAETERDFIARTRKFLREELNCRALLTDMNAWSNPIQAQAARQEMDYVDDHFYVDHPQFIEQPWRLPSRSPNTSPVAEGAPGGRYCAFTRLVNKPFTITEFNYSGPGRFRGVGGILTGVLGSVQDWSGIWRFAYSHTRDNLFKPGGAGYFDLASDPLSQAADRASLCLFLRGDMQPARRSVAIAMTPQDLLEAPRTARGVAPSWTGLALVSRVGTVVAPAKAKVKGVDLLLPLSPGKNGIDPYAGDAGVRLLAEMRKRGWVRKENPTDFAAPRFQSDNGELTVDGPEDILTLDTPRTAGGYAPAGKQVETRAVTVAIQDAGATVWVSSLDNAPIAGSRRLLVTHLTDLQNTGTRYGDKARRILLEWGRTPHLVRKGRALVTIRMQDAAKARVYSLATSGRRTGEVAAHAEKGVLTLPLDVDANGKARMLYEVEVAP